MWVKSADRRLLNLSHARLIEVFPSGEKFAVVAQWSDESETDFVELQRDLSEASANELVERISRAIDGNDRFLDLTRVS